MKTNRIVSFLILWVWIPAAAMAQSAGSLPDNLGRIVEVATPNGVLPQAHTLIGWIDTGMAKQSSSQNTYRIFANTPYLTFLNRNESNLALNRYQFFGAPSFHQCIEIRFGDSSYYWINAAVSGGNLSAQKAPFSIYLVEARPVTNTTITGGQKMCFKVQDEDGNNLYTPGEKIYILGDLALPPDSMYADLGLNATNPFAMETAFIYALRFGKSAVPYSQNSFTLSADGYLPPAGTVIRFIARTADTLAPLAAINDIRQDTGTHTHAISWYSYERPQFQLLQAPARMSIDSIGQITWTTYAYQRGNSYPVSIKMQNGKGQIILSFMATANPSSPSGGYTEYKAETGGNQIRFWQQNDGSIGFRASTSDFGMEYPKGTGYSLNYAGGIYVGVKKPGSGSDPDTVSVSNYEFSGEYQPGRIMNTGPFSGLIAEDFNNYPTFFALPDHAAFWPPEAPRNENGFPLQLSGKDGWTVFNDIDLSKHKRDGMDSVWYSPGLGIEVQRQTFQYEHYPFNHAVLVRYRIMNKTNRLYTDAYIGFWDDADVGGDYSDDLCQADSALSLVITYSSGNDPANTAQGKVILQGPVITGTTGDTASVIQITSAGLTGKIIPGKKCLTATSALSPRKMLDEPTRNSGDITRYYSISGLDPVTGYPKPNGAFDLIGGQYPSDTRSLISTGPFQLAPGDTQEIWMAYIGGQGVSNSAAMDTVRYYAQRILDDFRNNRIYAYDQTPPVVSVYALSTPAMNRVRFVMIPNERLRNLKLTVSGKTLNFIPYINGYAADYAIQQAGNLTVQTTATDLAGNVGTTNKTYQVAALNKAVQVGRYTFKADGQGYLLTSKSEAMHIPETAVLIGEPVEWLATQPDDKMKVEFDLKGIDLTPVQNRYGSFDVLHMGLYAWDGETWIPVETSYHSGILSSMAKGRMMAVFYNPDGKTVPEGWALEQNYPNPFNPVTTIRYQLAESGKTVLKIYNLLGQEVRTLVQTYQPAGRYTVLWDGLNNRGQRVSSGVYLYRLETGGYVKTRKMILMK